MVNFNISRINIISRATARGRRLYNQNINRRGKKFLIIPKETGGARQEQRIDVTNRIPMAK